MHSTLCYVPPSGGNQVYTEHAVTSAGSITLTTRLPFNLAAKKPIGH